MLPSLDARNVERFANLALACIQREYPNKIAHVLNSDADARPPRELTPAFYGCFDWHSSVHGHWLLVRLLRLFPNSSFESAAREALRANLTAENLAKESDYLHGEGRASFERPYGLAWLLQLCAELYEWDDPDSHTFAQHIRPLEEAVVHRISAWLPKLPYPVRSGEHSQTAFALGLILDYARVMMETGFEQLLRASALRLYLVDHHAPLHFEPSGEDFLSPSLAEADLMRRALDAEEFAIWLRRFLPQLPDHGHAQWLQPAVSPDRADGKLAHLDGLNLSRAWMLEGIASALSQSDPRLPAVESAARQHAEAGLAAVTGEHYEGGHWLGSFAVYLVTRRGIRA
ncbi:conserved hypothetical protein [Candidatus Koribacter versatilis Ellin345]|uniref:DUF2891 domain-containing protein n=1 Tax=Koribacter versatilis (strain Ellin345) TaxID=204669 RepID=Q1IKC1_KORVE|nr:DUF2891 domain-containing protein [Candidatus Koribacter versatilis]ABF42679.1 conserved hypothetical protein [Candidatus Koribacter versatilis Ellin345]